MTILYIDELSEDETVALTSNPVSVAYNLAMYNIPDEKDKTVIFTAGKYICILWPTVPPCMNILNVRLNPESMRKWINAPEFRPSVRIKLAEIVERYNKNYHLNKDNVVLEIGKPPTGVS